MARRQSPFTIRRFKGTDEEVRAQWLESRTHGLGGSDAATVLGANKYRTAADLWLEKTGRVETPDISGKDSVYWGNVLEDTVAKEFARRHPEMKVSKVNGQLVSKEHPFMLADIDRKLKLGKSTGLLEIKTAGGWRARDWEDGVPAYYLPQVVHYLCVTGFEFAWVAALIGGQRYVEYEVHADDEDKAALIEAEREFWEEYVAKGVMPQVESAPVEMWSKPSEYRTQASTDLDVAIAQYVAARDDEKAAGGRKAYWGAKLREIIGDDSRGYEDEAQGIRVMWVRGEGGADMGIRVYEGVRTGWVS